MKGSDLHPKDHSIQLFTDASNEGWGVHLDQCSTKGLWSNQEKRLHAGLTAYAYPPTALIHRVIQKMVLPDHPNSPRPARDALVLGPSVALNRDPTSTPGANNTSQAVPQSCVP